MWTKHPFYMLYLKILSPHSSDYSEHEVFSKCILSMSQTIQRYRTTIVHCFYFQILGHVVAAAEPCTYMAYNGTEKTSMHVILQTLDGTMKRIHVFDQIRLPVFKIGAKLHLMTFIDNEGLIIFHGGHTLKR